MPKGLALHYGREALKPQSTGAIVKGILHLGSITLIYGEPKSGKSFLATDLFASIAASDDSWMGHKIVKPGPVVYVTCEGHGSFWKRLQALAIHRWGSIDDFPDRFVLAAGRPPLVGISAKNLPIPQPQAVIDAWTDCCRRLGAAPVAMAIDTVFRSFGAGNVNSSDHMNAYVEAIQQVIDKGTAVALIHHATKAGASPAGSVSLMGACDTLIHTVNADGHSWEVEMAKDDAETAPRAFELKVVDIGPDPDGEDASSCVVVDLNETAPRMKGRPKRVEERELLMRLLYEVVNDRGRPPNGAGGVPPMIALVVEVDHWRVEFMRRNRPDEADDTKRAAFRRMVRDLQGQNRIGVSGPLVWPIMDDING